MDDHDSILICSAESMSWAGWILVKWNRKLRSLDHFLSHPCWQTILYESLLNHLFDADLSNLPARHAAVIFWLWIVGNAILHCCKRQNTMSIWIHLLQEGALRLSRTMLKHIIFIFPSVAWVRKTKRSLHLFWPLPNPSWCLRHIQGMRCLRKENPLCTFCTLVSCIQNIPLRLS